MLHSYQQYCVGQLLHNHAYMLLLDPGLGKTLTTLTALDALVMIGQAEKILVIAPLNVARYVWRQEAKKWGIDFTVSLVVGTAQERIKALKVNSGIFIINVENVPWLVEHDAWVFDTVVLDELSLFKSRDTNRFRAMRQVLPKIKRIYGLTGTPSPNSLLDLWSQTYLMDRGKRLGKHITKYRQEFFIEKTNYNSDRCYTTYDIKPGAEEIIHERISDIAVSMRAADYLNLPKRTDNIIKIHFDSKLKAQYAEFVRERYLEVGGGELVAVNAAVLAGKLLQFTGGAVYDTGEVWREVHRLKIDELLNLVHELQGNPVIVYYWFKHELERIKKAIPYAVELDSKNIETFNCGEIPVLLAHPASAGHGLNLQEACHTICWYTLPHGSLEKYIQANNRVDRQGQTRPVQVHHLICEGTYDEYELKLLQSKGDSQDRLLEAVKAALKGVLYDSRKTMDSLN